MSAKSELPENEQPSNEPPRTAAELAKKIIAEAEANKVKEGQAKAEEAGLLEAKDAEIAALKDQALRAMAEAENTRRRAKQQVEESSQYAVTGFARDVIGVLENLYRATATVTPEILAENETLKKFNEGIEMTTREFLSVLDRHGIKRIDPTGEKFDHHFHQAISQIPSPDHAPETVVQVVQAGYKIKDRLLRPALVVVAKAE